MASTSLEVNLKQGINNFDKIVSDLIKGIDLKDLLPGMKVDFFTNASEENKKKIIYLACYYALNGPVGLKKTTDYRGSVGVTNTRSIIGNTTGTVWRVFVKAVASLIPEENQRNSMRRLKGLSLYPTEAEMFDKKRD
jgi:hypothetical protein